MVPSSDIAFTASVKAMQARRGSRAAYARLESDADWESRVTPELAAFLAEQESVFLATANAAGQPYAQHRGGPKGFIHRLDEKTLAFADYRGNRQYITQGNLADNPQAFIIAVDHWRRRRVKIWGRARVIDDDAALVAQLMSEGYRARPSRRSCSMSRRGTSTARATSRSCCRPARSRRRSPACSSASRSSRPKTRPCARSAPEAHLRRVIRPSTCGATSPCLAM